MRAYAGSLVLHVGVVALVLVALMRPTRVGMRTGLDLSHQAIGAFVSAAPTGTAGVTPAAPKKRVQARDTTPTPATDNVEQTGSEQTGSGQGAGSIGSGTGPVRLDSGEGLQIIKKVQPVYPRLMEVARTEGVVVVDAIVHRDGTVGDIKVLKSTGTPFEQAAIDALKQWRYVPIPYEGLITVTINFILRS